MTGRSSLDDIKKVSYASSLPQIHHSGRNVFSLLVRREVSPRTKCLPRWQWGSASKQDKEYSHGPQSEAMRDARRGLFSWVEAESLHHLSAKYCPLVPPPRSTIAAAFSPDGKKLASTHGDHTVKIIDCQTGHCLKVLRGHRRTPWVVRFHPEHSEILASGSLDHEVRLWDANTSECIGSRDFYRPIASIAFHAEGEVLAVAAGHKLYIWHYNRKGETSSPSIVLKTRRSLRAVHFHPHGAPFLLTAEVNDLDSDSSMTQATSLRSLYYPSPAIYVANLCSNDHLGMAAEIPLMSLPSLYLPLYAREDSRTDLQLGSRSVGPGQFELGSSASEQFRLDMTTMGQDDHMVMSPAVASSSHTAQEETFLDPMETTEVQFVVGHQQHLVSAAEVSGPIGLQPDRIFVGSRQHQFLHSRDPASWDLQFLHGWLIAQNQAGIPHVIPVDVDRPEHQSEYLGAPSATSTSNLAAYNRGISRARLAMPSTVNRTMVSGTSGLQDHSLLTHLISASEYRQVSAPVSARHDGSESLSMISRIQSELAASATSELPCTVKLRIWPHDIKSPCDSLDLKRCYLTIPHAVLCSEMGAHFSPCGRFLAACVACSLHQAETDPGLLTQLHHDVSGAGTSPTRHPISARQVMYELRIYSLEEATFGSVLVSRATRAAHCLTSIQFSPTSEHILLAYGRRHSSLLKSIVINGDTSLPIYTVLEVYRVSDLELVSVLPSAEDEVNVACFHPLAGGGLVYGTKEGKLRVLQYDGSHDKNCTGPNFSSKENMAEVEHHSRFRHML
ncbi:hypothetical protein NMG60_11034608 [Bertholletia excelsa]